MKNLHIEHPEDTILTGDLSAIDALYDFDHTSVKIDGAPAIVWGTNPENGQFFVGTKSVFNKRIPKICYTEEDIFTFYDEETQSSLIEILVNCLEYIPRTDGIYQGDFIGFGGSSTYKPNTITYTFDEIITQHVIIAPHTFYDGSVMKEMEAYQLHDDLSTTLFCKFVHPIVDRVRANVSAPVIETRNIKFLDKKTAETCKKIVNCFIREGKPLTDALLTEIFGCAHLANLYQMVIEMKEELIDSFIVTNCPKSTINGLNVKQEGFVITDYSDYSGRLLKLVDRERFSVANFNNTKFN